MTKQYTAALIETLTEEAQKALKNGTTWERSPESAEECSPFVSWCDDCETYHLDYYGFGERVEDGTAYLTVHSCDMDGNWEYENEAEIGTPEATALEAEYGYDASRPGWLAYLQHVAETGQDPIGEFPTSERKVKRKWQVRLGAWIGQKKLGLLLIGARRNSRGEWLAGEKLPQYVRDYLTLKQSGVRWYCEDVKSVDELSAHVKLQRPVRATRATFVAEIEETIPGKSDLRKRARIALRDYRKRS